MNKMQIIKKLNKIEKELENLTVELGTLYLKNPDNNYIGLADEQIDEAYNDLVEAIYNLKICNVE